MKELTPITLPRCYCDFCKHKVFHNKSACIRHEDKCYKNPNRNCPTCNNEGRIDEVMNNGYMGHRNLNCYSCEIAQKVGGKSYIPTNPK